MPKHKPARKDSTSDSDSGPDDRGPAKKSKSAESTKKNNSDAADEWDLGRNKLVRLSEFKGKWYVNIREFYNSDGELRPTKKGIMLTMEQYQKLKGCIEDIDEAIKRNV